MQSIESDETIEMELQEELPSTSINLKEARQQSDPLAAGAGRSHRAPCHGQYNSKPSGVHWSSTGGDDVNKMENKMFGPVTNDSSIALLAVSAAAARYDNADCYGVMLMR